MTTPYTYTLTFLPTGQVYYGVSYREGCHPDELMKSYFSSSRIVRDLMNEHGHASFDSKIRKRFESKKAARDWEQKLLLRVSAASNPKFLNQSNNMKGILRKPGTYTWIYNPDTKEKRLVKKTHPVPTGFLPGLRGPDEKQRNTLIITNEESGKEKRIKIGSPLPDGFISKRLRGTTSGTKWICNDQTRETQLIQENERMPVGWRLGNLHTDNKGTIKIYKDNPYMCVSIHPDEFKEYSTQGWKKGNPRTGHCSIFKMNESRELLEYKKILSVDYPKYKKNGWFKGEPKLYKISFTDGTVVTAPYQWFEKYYGIKSSMILYAAARDNCNSRKYKFTKVEVIDT